MIHSGMPRQHNLALTVDAVDLENVLGEINANTDRYAHAKRREGYTLVVELRH